MSVKKLAFFVLLIVLLSKDISSAPEISKFESRSSDLSAQPANFMKGKLQCPRGQVRVNGFCRIASYQV